MRRSIASTLAVILCTLLLGVWLPGRAWAHEVCPIDQQGLNQSLTNFLTQFTVQLNQDAKEVHELNEQALAEVSATRPSSDGFSEGGRLDLLRRAFVGLDVGQVTDEEGKLVFNFNPELLRLDSFGQFSPRVTVHKAELDSTLAEHINTLDDEDLRTPARDDLEKKLGDLDDVEYTLRWTPKAFEPAEDLQEVASTLLDQVVPAQPSDVTQKLNDARVEMAGILGMDAATFRRVTMRQICGDPGAKAVLERAVQDLRVDIPQANEALQKALDDNGFTRLADLIEGSLRLVVDLSSRQRSGAAGPDTRSIDLTLQRGWVSYRGAKSFARRQGKAAIDVDSLNDYFAKYGRLEGAAPLFSLVASYTDTDSFLIPIAGVDDPFRLDAGHKISIKGTAASYFGGGRDRKLELTAGYDDASNDDSLNDRFVANLTWVETLNSTLAAVAGGSELVVTLVWADKPEFRGEVDEELGLRAGLKWSLGDGKQK